MLMALAMLTDDDVDVDEDSDGARNNGCVSDGGDDGDGCER